MKYLNCTLGVAGLSLMGLSVDAATIFETSTTGNASSLSGVGAGDVTTLNLSVADGGGTIDLTTVGAFNGTGAQTMLISGDAFGVGNQRWGNTDQRWIFSFDQEVSFDAVGFRRSGQGMRIQSVAWKDDAGATGGSGATAWTFSSDGTVGTFAFNSGDTTNKIFDFTGASVSNVPAGTEITIRHTTGAGGAEMQSFTITPIPEPGSLALVGLGGLLVARRRRG